MNKPAKLIILFILFAAIVVAIILIPKESTDDNETNIVQSGGDPLGIVDSTEEKEEEGEIIFTCFPSSSLEWTNPNGENFKYVKKSYYWVKPDDETSSIKDMYIEEMIECIENIHSQRTIENVENLSEFGFDNPLVSITVDGDKIIQIGNKVSTSDNYYLNIGDGNVYIVSPRILNVYSTDADELYFYVDPSENSASTNDTSTNDSNK